jgi:pyruvate dehydrogenase E1 component
VLAAQQILEERYDVAADVWSVTSYQELYRDGHAAERWNRLHPGETPRSPTWRQCLGETEGPIVAASDYVKALPTRSTGGCRGHRVARHRRVRAQRRAGALRDFFEVDAKFIVQATLNELMRDGKLDVGTVPKAIADLGIDPEKPNPANA